MMDLPAIIAALQTRKREIDSAIRKLEQLQGKNQRTAGRRGPKSMKTEERQQVSDRMKRYWAQRRKNVIARTADA